MKRWTLRELLLLITVLAFALIYVGNAIRLRVVAFVPFGVSIDELTDWAREIDPDVRRWALSGGSVPLAGGRERWNELDLEIGATDMPKIIEQWRTRIAEKAEREHWQSFSEGTGTERFGFGLANGDSRYETVFYWHTRPLTSPESSDGNRVRLSVRWFEIGYTRLFDDKHLVNDPVAADAPK